jgi:hypothetical protein
MLEIGIVATIVGLVAGIGLLLSGWALGGARRVIGHRQSAPSSGEISASRHLHTAAVSAR